jgi:toxin ParE1/3/4
MEFRVVLTADAERDLEQIVGYIAEHDLPEKALYVLGQIQSLIDDLSNSPHRGSIPQELAALGLREYREVFFKPYRIVYRVIDADVYVYLIADGRRDLFSLLGRRLLER